MTIETEVYELRTFKYSLDVEANLNSKGIR